jgi:hypothetical protein
MTGGRASIFDEETDLDLSGFERGGPQRQPNPLTR